VNAFADAVTGASRFSWLMTRFTTPDEVFGPISLKALKERDCVVRATAGKLPGAQVAFLDECFKANSAILNSLLTLVNERTYDDGEGSKQVPLELLVGASNELPEGPELAALYDRFMLRFWVQPTSGIKDFSAMLKSAAATGKAATAKITLDDLRAAQAEARKIPLSDDLAQKLFQLRQELANVGVIPSDRRWVRSLDVLRATAWLAGEPQVDETVFSVLSDVLWDDPEKAAEIAKLVGKFASPELAQARKVSDSVKELLDRWDADAAKAPSSVDGLAREGKRAMEELVRLQAAAKPSPARKIQALQDELRTRLRAVVEQARNMITF
jgi:MoxR-like ATPase